MELSQFTDYSLRALIFVGLRGGEKTSVKEITEAFQISQHHLVKVVHNLAKLDYLKTYRGRGGGLMLAKSPEEIGVGALVRQTENLALVECFPPRPGTCCIAGVCELQQVLGRARQAFLAELDRVTLADLIRERVPLEKRLGIAGQEIS